MAKHVIAAAARFSGRQPQACRHQRPPHRRVQHQGRILRARQSLPASGRQPVPRPADRAGRASEPGQYRYSRQGESSAARGIRWEFDVRTGKSWCDPSRVRARQFAVSVTPGSQLVEGPYVAETFSSVSKTNMSCSTRDASIGGMCDGHRRRSAGRSEPAERQGCLGHRRRLDRPGWGNGKAAAVLYAREGAKVFVVDARKEAADETVRYHPRCGRRRDALRGRCDR